MVWENDIIESGPLAGKTLGEVAAQNGTALLGTKSIERTGNRFPLLIKLLDCAQWLSLQVHPNDELAVQMEGPCQFGEDRSVAYTRIPTDSRKSIAGLKPNISADVLANSIRNSSIIDHVQYAPVSQGDTIFMPAGTLHALGPGLLVYEVQQTSDWTYRVYDWGRPQTETRKLHIEKSIQSTRADFTAPIIPPPAYGDGTTHKLVECEYFTLELLSAASHTINLDTKGESFHAITVIEGNVILKNGGEQVQLEKFQTAVVPANMGAYQLIPAGNCKALKSSA